jgi:hypothetical protein
MKTSRVVAGGLIGGVLGYFIGTFISCYWLYPTSNLCGIIGVFVTGPIGLTAGVVVGLLYRGSKRKDHDTRA